MFLWKTSPYAHRLLLILAGGFVLNILTQNAVASYTALLPPAVLWQHQWWRILTYPFADTDFWNLFSTSLLLYFFAPEIEQLLTTKRFVRYSAIFAFLHGVLYLLLMHNSSFPLVGLHTYALAVLTVFAYFYPHVEFFFFGLITMRMWVLATVIIGFSVVSSLLGVVQGYSTVAAFFADATSGVIIAFLFAHIYFQKYRIPFLSFLLRSRATPPPPSPTLYQPSITPTVQKAQYFPRHEKRTPAAAVASNDDDELNEQQLNAILDKISDQGKDSLTQEEQQFLEEYARRL